LSVSTFSRFDAGEIKTIDISAGIDSALPAVQEERRTPAKAPSFAVGIPLRLKSKSQ
jgi:hypothetical protein